MHHPKDTLVGSELQETEGSRRGALNEDNKALGRGLCAADYGDLQGDFDA